MTIACDPVSTIPSMSTGSGSGSPAGTSMVDTSLHAPRTAPDVIPARIQPSKSPRRAANSGNVSPSLRITMLMPTMIP